MLGLPKTTEISRILSKDDILKNADFGKITKAQVSSKIERVRIVGILNSKTLNIAAGETWKEIDIIQIELKNSDIEDDIIKSIDKSIPRPIVYALKNDYETVYDMIPFNIDDGDVCGHFVDLMDGFVSESKGLNPFHVMSDSDNTIYVYRDDFSMSIDAMDGIIEMRWPKTLHDGYLNLAGKSYGYDLNDYFDGLEQKELFLETLNELVDNFDSIKNDFYDNLNNIVIELEMYWNNLYNE